jgi:hypothetical protein
MPTADASRTEKSSAVFRSIPDAIAKITEAGRVATGYLTPYRSHEPATFAQAGFDRGRPSIHRKYEAEDDLLNHERTIVDNQTNVASSDQELFAQFQQDVVQVNDGVTTDAQEWATLATICSGGTIVDYASAASRQLWINGEDQGSWTIIKDAATEATSQPEYPALLTVMQGFNSITDPSHNSSAWSDLAQRARYVMANAGKNPALGQ